MAYDFSGKRALVTGAGRGIGKEIAKELAKCNAQVFALDLIQENLNKLKDEIPSVDTVCVDLSNWKETRAAIENLGVIDLLVNNAGIGKMGSFQEITEDDFDKLFAVNVKPVINVSQVIVKALRKHGKPGSIVNTSSASVTIYFPSLAAYSASKAAVNKITETMAVELGPYGVFYVAIMNDLVCKIPRMELEQAVSSAAIQIIRVNAVNPTMVGTEMIVSLVPEELIEKTKCDIPLKRIAETSDVASAVLFLLSDKAGMINGTCLHVDGGHRVA